MARETRPVIAINEVTGERKNFSSVYRAAKEIGSTHVQVLISLAMGSSAHGWMVYDTPENIRKRIAELQEVIKRLEEGVKP